MSKSKDRFESIYIQSKQAQSSGQASFQLLRECQQLRQDVLRCAQELGVPDGEPELAETIEEFQEIAQLLGQLTRCLTRAEFEQLDGCLDQLRVRMHSAEIRAEAWDEENR